MNKKKSDHFGKELNQQLFAVSIVVSMKESEYQPNQEQLKRPLNQALALYIKSVLNTVPSVESSRNIGNKQTRNFLLPHNNSIRFVYFYFWSKEEIDRQEDAFFIGIEYGDQYKDIYGHGLTARSFSFTLKGQTTPQKPNKPADYELIDYCLYSLNREYSNYFPNFREFELEFYKQTR